MADVNINKFRASVVRDGSKPASPGFIVSEGQDPVDPAGNGQNHLPVTIATAATGLSITDSQVLGGAGTVGQYIRGDGSLADFPQASGGGSSVSYYLNGSISQGTIGGVAYKELNKVPILGAGTDFTINADGYIASFLTDAGDPNLLEIPGGNWNFETYFSASSSGGTPTFYVELYKYDGTTFTLIASSSSSPELIAFGTNLNPYFSTLAVPTTTLALTDRLAVRFYVNHSGRTITLHTENNHLCQVVTTFTTGLTSLNGLTAQVQNLAVGTSGTDFNIASATATHTFNLPTASATNRGALSSADWTTFNNKQNALGYVPVPETRTITINGTSQDLSANRTYNVGTVTSVGLSSATSGVTIGGSPVTGVGAFTLAIATASGSQNGLLSSTDWTTFNNKQNALTNPVTGTGLAGQIAYFTGTSAIISESGLTWDATNNNLSIGGATANSNLTVSGSDNTNIFTVLSGVNSRLHVGTLTTGTLVYLRSQNNYGLNLGVNNTDYLTISNAGNSSFFGNITLANGANRFVRIGSSTAYYYDLQTTGDDFQIIEAGTTPRLTIKYPNGNVLINTTTDNGARLQVSGNGIFNANSGALTSDILTVRGGGSSGAFGFRVEANNGEDIFFVNNLSYNITMCPIAGNVGIGTSSPSNFNGLSFTGPFLDVAGLIQIKGTSANTVAGIQFGGDTYRKAIIYSTIGTEDPALVFITASSGTSSSATERMRITSSGNVLIGTTTDSGSKLRVEGGELRVTTSNSGVALYQNGGNGEIAAYNWGGGAYIPLVHVGSEHRFNTSTTERMRITSGGDVYFGNTTISVANTALFFTKSNGNIIQVFSHSSGTVTIQEYYKQGSGLTGSITYNGTNTLYNATSDYRLKEDLKNYNALQILGKLKTYDFKWKNTNTRDFGMLAHELQEVLPNYVSGQKDELTDDKSIKPQVVDYSKIVPLLIKSIQELKQEIDTLKN